MPSTSAAARFTAVLLIVIGASACGAGSRSAVDRSVTTASDAAAQVPVAGSDVAEGSLSAGGRPSTGPPPSSDEVAGGTVPASVPAVDASPGTDPPPEPSVTVGPIVVPPPPAETTAAPVVRSGDNVSPDPVVGDPLSISIPAIGVESPLVSAGVLDDGTVAVPPDPNIAGWFSEGPRPGEIGPAVIMGHVDSKKTGPGVFWHLADLPVGSVVTIATTSGPLDFVVTAVERFPKDQFPSQRVYGPVPEPALRLITCGGSFDRSIGHYRDNVIAFLEPERG